MKFIFVQRETGNDRNSGKRGKPVRSLRRMLRLIKKRFPKKKYPTLVIIGQTPPRPPPKK